MIPGVSQNMMPRVGQSMIPRVGQSMIPTAGRNIIPEWGLKCVETNLGNQHVQNGGMSEEESLQILWGSCHFEHVYLIFPSPIFTE